MKKFYITKIDDVINGIALKATNLDLIWVLRVNIEHLEDSVAGGFVTVSIDTFLLRYSVSGWLKSKRY